MELREWATQRFGTSNGRRLIEPTVYPERELQEDLITLDRSHREIESRIDELNDELESIYEEGAQAPEFKRQALAERAGVIENSLDQQKAAYRAKSKKLGLLRAIKGVRERMGSEDLHVDGYMEEADSTEIQATIRSQLTDLRLESEDVNEIMDLLNFSAEQATASAGSNTDKHIERMENHAEEREFRTESSRDSNRSRQMSD
jgi:hypothetical protein